MLAGYHPSRRPVGTAVRHATAPKSVQKVRLPGLAQNGYQDSAYLAVAPRAAWPHRRPDTAIGDPVWSSKMPKIIATDNQRGRHVNNPDGHNDDATCSERPKHTRRRTSERPSGRCSDGLHPRSYGTAVSALLGLSYLRAHRRAAQTHTRESRRLLPPAPFCSRGRE